jgi:hypothetical protein
MAEGQVLCIGHIRTWLGKGGGSGSDAAASNKRRAVAQPSAGRHVAWAPREGRDVCVQRGRRAFESEAAIDAAFRARELAEEDLYVFFNGDAAERNEEVPRYEGVFAVSNGGGFRKAKKAHMKLVYAGRTDRSRMWHVDPTTNVPYWVDRYAFCKMRQYRH